MPTNEERLTALEQQRRITDENFTIILGMLSGQEGDIKRLLQLSEQHSELLVRIVGRLDAQSTLLALQSDALKAIMARLPENPQS